MTEYLNKFKNLLYRDDYPTDELVINEVWDALAYGEQSLFEDKIVFDVGANIGAFTCYAGKVAKHVVAVEPEPHNFSLLEKNVQLNKLSSKVTLINAAVAGESKPLWVTDLGGNSSTSTSEIGSFVDNVVTLQELFEPYNTIDFLKMDVEGMELDIFLNTSIDVINKIDSFAIEYHGVNLNWALMMRKLSSVFNVELRSNVDCEGVYGGLAYSKGKRVS